MKYIYLLPSRMLSFFLVIGLTFGSLSAVAQDRTALDNDVNAAIKKLLATSPAAKELASSAEGLLVFPKISKAGFVIGVQYGNGALVRPKKSGGYYVDDYFSIKSASGGIQVGVQSFGDVMILMTDTAVEHIETSNGWEELGTGPSIVIVNKGIAKTLTTKTAKSDVYAFTFGLKGLMAGLDLQGTRIQRLRK